MKPFGWIIFCFMLLAACVQAPSRPSVQPAPAKPAAQATPPKAAQAPAEPANIDVLMQFAQNFAGLSPEAQKREYGQVSARRRSELARMQMVMMAVVPTSRYKDDARAAVLVDEYLRAADSRDEGLRTLAAILRTLLAAPRQDENIAQLTQKLKDEQKRSDMLQRKLDDLLAVEKTMYDRRETPQR